MNLLMVMFTVVWNSSKSDTFRLSLILFCPNGIDRLDELITILPRSTPALIIKILIILLLMTI